ncbi:MAG TPA: DUF2961 domain-containing protein [Thermoanaerobaculia bacterium]|nr:DUF2961 domain-containing protein [Thermoanaerobaculia bacterium]
MTAKPAAARTHAAAALLAVFIVFIPPSPAAAALPWEWWRDLSQLARLPDGDQVLLRSSHCPSQCRFDRSSAGDTRFLRVADGEAVIFDEPGAGAITRIWMTMGAAGGGSTTLDRNVRIRVRVDGESVPRVDLPLPELFDGTHPPFTAPLALDLFRSSGGNVSYVPIPYRRGCTVSLVGAESARIWYQIGFHRLASAAGVTSFRGDEDLSGLRAALSTPAGVDPWPQPQPHLSQLLQTLAVGEERVAWERQGAGELRRLRLRAPRESWGRLRLLLDFDGARRVDLTLADFFAASPAPVPTMRSLLAGADDDGLLYAYFPMPFARSARVSLRSEDAAGPQPVEVEWELGWSEAPPAPDAAPFFATARSLETADPERDLTLLEHSGAGKWVGLFLQLAGIGTPARDYLEGDERVYVDGATSPSIYGTGVEDFFNGGFFFDRGAVIAPLHGSIYQLQTSAGDSVDGMYRLLLADAVPFHGGLRVALENGPGPPTGHLRMDARAVAYGYSRDAGAWQLVDRLDLTSARSTRDHHYQPPRRARCAAVTGTFESDPPQTRTAIGCSFGSGKSRFTLRSPRPGPLRLRRLLDAAAGAPEADVYVAGRKLATFPYVAANPFRRWQELDLDLPLSGGGPLQIAVAPHAEPGGAATHTEFAYELWQPQ